MQRVKGIIIMLNRVLQKSSGKKRGTLSVFLFFAVFLLFASCSKSPEGHKAEIEQKGVSFSNEAFLKAVNEGDRELVVSFIKAGIDINAKEDDGRTALLIAAENGDAGMAALIADNGADMNACDIDGYTALMYAAYKGNLELADFLLQHGADVQAKDKDGWTALRIALLQGKTDVAELLKKHGSEKK
jgi:ankyrin repeat protein